MNFPLRFTFYAFLALVIGHWSSGISQGVALKSKPQTNSISFNWHSNFFAIEIPAQGTNSTQLISGSNLVASVLQQGSGVTFTYKTNGLEIAAAGVGEVTTVQLLAASNAVWAAQAAKAPTNNANLGTTSSSGIPLTLRAAAGQDGNMLNVRDSSGSITFAIAYDGQLVGVGANSARLASTSAAGEVWTASDTTGIGSFTAIPQQTNSSIARQTELTSMSNTLVTATAGKQHGSFVLTNFALMGITNIVSANGNTVITTNSGVLTLTTASGSGGVGPTNANQFGASLTLTIKDGALLTNTSIRTALTLPTLTVSRAAVLNSTGQLTNSAAVSDVELEYLDGVTSAIQTQLGTKTALATNSSQFGASTTLTIADRASLTNINVYGTGAVFSGHVTVTSNITAQSFIGSGTGVPILKLQTMMSADNAFAISVRTNFTQSTTNFFEVTNASAGQAMVLHSAAAGQLVWTNGAVGVRITGIQTNTTSVQCDWTTSDIVHITNSLIANVVIIPTNMVSGSSLRVVAQASTQTYTLSVSNAAGTVVLYPFASTNGGSAYTVTNGQTVELDLLSLNGKIHAAMGRFQ